MLEGPSDAMDIGAVEARARDRVSDTGRRLARFERGA